MSGKKDGLSVKEWTSLDQAVRFLEDLVSSLKTGKVTLTHAGRTLALEPAREVALKTSVKRKEDKVSLGIKLTWLPGEGAGDEGGVTLGEESPPEEKKEAADREEKPKGKPRRKKNQDQGE